MNFLTPKIEGRMKSKSISIIDYYVDSDLKHISTDQPEDMFKWLVIISATSSGFNDENFAKIEVDGFGIKL